MAQRLIENGTKRYGYRLDIDRQEAGYNARSYEKNAPKDDSSTNLLTGIIQWLSPHRADNSNQETE